MQNRKVYITHNFSATSLGTEKQEILDSLAFHNPIPIFPSEESTYRKPFYIVPKEYSEYPNDDTRSAKIIHHLLVQCADFIESHGNIPFFLASSTGGIEATEKSYSDLTKNKSAYSIFENHFFNRFDADVEKHVTPEKISSLYTFSTACSSSGHAIMQAYRMIKSGVIDYAIVIGIDTISKTTMIGFDSLQLVSENQSKPLTENRDGLTLGEGAGILVLQNAPTSDDNFEIVGVASGVDGHHITAPDPSGTNQKHCINAVLEQAGIKACDVEYVSTHGTGTPMNDKVELEVLKEIFGNSITVTSLKSYIGHTLGASTVDEISICIDMLKEKFIYQPNNFSNRMSDIVLENSTPKKVNYFLKNSFGFGGNNVSVLIKTNIS